MSRKINYYHPVKDLIPADYRKTMLETWEKEKFIDFYDPSKIITLANETYGRAGINDYSPEKVQLIAYGLHGNNDHNLIGYYRFHTSNTNEKITNHPIVSIFEEIVEIYEGHTWALLHSADDTKNFVPHIDPTFSRSCCIQFPLSPDYSQFRDTNFYENEDPESYLFGVNYGALRSPVLLNLRKYHGVGWDKPTKSLTFQISFKKPYSDVRKRLEERKLLSTPV